MVVMFNGAMVFKEENISPQTFTDMKAQYKGDNSYPFADVKIRKLSLRSFDF